MDRHVDSPEDSSFIASGVSDFNRARKKTGMPISKYLSIMEIGCGLGRMTEAMAPHYKKITAIDISDQFIQWARLNSSSTNVQYTIINSCNFNIISQLDYDIAISYEVFHYLDHATLKNYFCSVAERSNRTLYFQMNTLAISIRTRASRIIRRTLNSIGIKEWRRWPTDPRFFHQVHDIQMIKDLLFEAGFKKLCIVDPVTQDTWFIASN
ncbi:MAG: hypothetical protein COA78_06100 [Blastopirellula sp.]|nr:MAG: hypothetical protein COA78_06100 [Blastopirellula sp.]